MSDGTYLIEEHELADMEQHIDRLRRAIIQVHLLIKSSDGVVGLYNNGDIKLWEDLLKGGRDEVWLLDYSKAIKDIDIESLVINDLPFDDGLESYTAELVEMLDYYVLCDQKLMGTLYEKEEEALRLIKKREEYIK